MIVRKGCAQSYVCSLRTRQLLVCHVLALCVLALASTNGLSNSEESSLADDGSSGRKRSNTGFDAALCCDVYQVSGAGTADVNGLYRRGRNRDGVPSYDKQEDGVTFTLLRFVFNSGARHWFLSQLSAVVVDDKDYYREPCTKDDDLPPSSLTQSFRGQHGKKPYPQIQCVEQVPCDKVKRTTEAAPDRAHSEFQVPPHYVAQSLRNLGYVVRNSSLVHRLQVSLPSERQMRVDGIGASGLPEILQQMGAADEMVIDVTVFRDRLEFQKVFALDELKMPQSKAFEIANQFNSQGTGATLYVPLHPLQMLSSEKDARATKLVLISVMYLTREADCLQGALEGAFGVFARTARALSSTLIVMSTVEKFREVSDIDGELRVEFV